MWGTRTKKNVFFALWFTAESFTHVNVATTGAATPNKPKRQRSIYKKLFDLIFPDDARTRPCVRVSKWFILLLFFCWSAFRITSRENNFEIQMFLFISVGIAYGFSSITDTKRSKREKKKEKKLTPNECIVLLMLFFRRAAISDWEFFAGIVCKRRNGTRATAVVQCHGNRKCWLLCDMVYAFVYVRFDAVASAAAVLAATITQTFPLMRWIHKKVCKARPRSHNTRKCAQWVWVGAY